MEVPQAEVRIHILDIPVLKLDPNSVTIPHKCTSGMQPNKSSPRNRNICTVKPVMKDQLTGPQKLVL